jgi:hypothetical protein
MPSSHERPLFPERDAEIVWLHKDVGWSRARIAKRHGISVDRVRQVEERWLRLEERSRRLEQSRLLRYARALRDALA